MSRPLDLTGHRFGRLVVIERFLNSKSGKAKWRCKCDCGNETIVFSTSLVRGLTHSCGCLNREVTMERFSTHRQSESRLYETWSGMKKRCYNPNSKSFSAYGGRGISICEEWLSNFANFKEWAENNGYDDSLTLDRINNDGDYTPTNCRWVTPREQALNTSRNHMVAIDGITKPRNEWSRLHGVNPKTVRDRLVRGWAYERAIKTPPDRRWSK